ncbi:MAG: IS1 family transposase [Acidobacteriota bacterium]|nr:IS1 family transposase [Acidobacteriota bacterium]
MSGCQVSRFHTDKWESYSKLIPGERDGIDKEGTLQTEQHNLNFRTHIKRLQRRKICFSKSEGLHDAVSKLSVKHPNQTQHHV